MTTAGSSSLGASPKYMQIDLTEDEPPFTVKDAFIEEYPTMDVNRSFVARTIIALEAGTLTLIDCDGDEVEMDFAAGEANAVQFMGIHATSGVDNIKVFL